ncbi:hypothetical protein [Bordetella bronchialis]|uniref:Uncharacterized protein n=1 Tax=Bordetella bronchialis TaxID=463025 RepID=A0A193FK95_9BORD|nr:hypothetical protein [Bordetella bronchialis]ANN67534.1 hypothetical protein BAU06_15600 [Bordetella bronchialis]ANN72623.1 hypothetical protein BAU08_15830 [Bordetella bronchialis]
MNITSIGASPALPTPAGRPAPQDGLMDWLPSVSAVAGAVGDWLESYVTPTLAQAVAASDAAQVGDLMIHGRDGAVLAPRPPATE